MIDPDGSGPLEPFMVTCLYYQGGPTETWVRHENEESTNVDGFPEPGGFVQVMKCPSLRHSNRWSAASNLFLPLGYSLRWKYVTN